MKRPYRRAPAGFRFCQRCEQQLPATPDLFVTDSSRASGIGYECRSCHAARRVGRNRSAESSGNLSGERRAVWKARQRRYFETPRGRAQYLRSRYKQIDSCDLMLDEVEDLIGRPCHYCGTLTAGRGLDRINNDLGHDRGNVLPACRRCNILRGRRWTVEEAVEHISQSSSK